MGHGTEERERKREGEREREKEIGTQVVRLGGICGKTGGYVRRRGVCVQQPTWKYQACMGSTKHE